MPYEVPQSFAGGRIYPGLDAQAGVERASFVLKDAELIAEELDEVIAYVATVRDRDLANKPSQEVQHERVSVRPTPVHRRSRDAGTTGDRLDRQPADAAFP
jgi:hypothetical protein